PGIAISAQRGRQSGPRDHDQRAAAVGVTEIGGEAAEIGEDRGDGDDRHHRFGADQGHQNQRHQRAGAVAGQAADNGGKQRDARDQQELKQGNIGEAGNDIHGLLSRVKRATAWSAMVLSAPSSRGKSAASQASSASASTCPSTGPSAIPRAMKSAALSGNFGPLQRSGRSASSRQCAESVSPPARAPASSKRPRWRFSPSRQSGARAV